MAIGGMTSSPLPSAAVCGGSSAPRHQQRTRRNDLLLKDRSYDLGETGAVPESTTSRTFHRPPTAALYPNCLLILLLASLIPILMTSIYSRFRSVRGCELLLLIIMLVSALDLRIDLLFRCTRAEQQPHPAPGRPNYGGISFLETDCVCCLW
jgi:hypothetical protein